MIINIQTLQTNNCMPHFEYQMIKWGDIERLVNLKSNLNMFIHNSIIHTIDVSSTNEESQQVDKIILSKKGIYAIWIKGERIDE